MSSASSRSDDSVAAALTAATAQLRREIQRIGVTNAVVLIDGRSGAGKTSLAASLIDAWPLPGGVQRLALDSVYPGWDGMDEAVSAVRDDVLVPHARGLVGSWRRWDWEASAPAERHTIDPGLPLVVEGSGLLTPSTAVLADVRVWVESPEESRQRRALDRDGDTYRPHWERWAGQEQRHVDRDRPREQATHVFAVP